jgi:hypothetical protein
MLTLVSTKHRLVVDVILLTMVPIAWLSGLVLFFDFHVHLGCFRSHALGLSRLTWQNLHRLSALAVVAGIAAHAWLNARVLGRRVVRIAHAHPARHDTHELFLYLATATVLVTGITAWFIVSGSPPLWGPVVLGPNTGPRHPWIDVHNLTALVSIVLSINHIRRRWRALVHLP